jgi:hypothetical protein
MNILLFLPLFILVSLLAFYVPGRVILGGQKNISKLGLFAVSYILGIVLWGWQAYIFGYLQLRWLSYLYLLVFLLIFIRKKYLYFKFPKIALKKLDIIIILIVAIGIFGQVMPFIKTGLVSLNGLFISTYNSCDHIWHAALAQELATRFPPDEPGLSGIIFSNYNFWFHLTTGEVSRVFHLPLLSVQFAGMYPMASILLAIIGYVFAINLFNSKFFVRIFLFFLFFSGDAIGWIFSLVNGNLMLNMSQGIDNATKFMDTPGYGLSVIIALSALYIFLKNKQKFSVRSILIIGLLIGSLVGFKLYMGIAVMLGFCFLSFFGVFKKNYSYFWIFIVAGIFSALQFLPFNSNSGGLFFLLLETPRGFISQKGLNLGFIDQRWGIYLAHHNYPRLLEYGIFMALFYLFAQFGIRLLGFIQLKKTIRILETDFFVLLYSILISSIILGMFFYQKVGGGNIWQFFLPASLMLTIFASLNLTVIFSRLNKIVGKLLIILIIIFTIPAWISFVGNYFKLDYLSSFHGVPASEFESYNFLKNNSPKNSLVLLIDQPGSGTCNIASIAKTLTERRLFFSGTGVSGVVFPEYIRREKDILSIKENTNEEVVSNILKKDDINYVVVYNGTPIAKGSPISRNEYLRMVFSNESTKIYKVIK